MDTILGCHVVISGYGLWLPGDQRGHWSEAWDPQIGYYEPRKLHDGDPVREQMAKERMKHKPVRLNSGMIAEVAETLRECMEQSDWSIAALSIEPTHTHMLLTYATRDIDNTVKWIKDQCTKSIHRKTNHTGPVWAKGRWRGFIENEEAWAEITDYIQAHNIRRGDPASPYGFVIPMMP